MVPDKSQKVKRFDPTATHPVKLLYSLQYYSITVCNRNSTIHTTDTSEESTLLIKASMNAQVSARRALLTDS